MGFVVLEGTNERLDVGKIVAAGANYRAHIDEMDAETPDEPVFFIKPSTSIVHQGSPIVFPSTGNVLHHEVELALVISQRCKEVDVQEAGRHVLGYAVALDLTLRDLQTAAKGSGLPWSTAKGFDCACPISEVIPVADLADVGDLDLGLRVNGEPRQRARTSSMLWTTGELIAHASRHFTLERGDVILTGTPAGVGPLERGDTVEAWLGDRLSVRFEVI